MRYCLLLLITPYLLLGCMRPVRIYKEDGKLMGIMPMKNGRVAYQDKQPLPLGTTKAEVFRRARRWWVDNYKSAKDVLQIVDPETGELVGKGVGSIYLPMPLMKKYASVAYPVTHTISIDITDTGYTITANGFVVGQPSHSYRGQITGYDEYPIEHYDVGTTKSVTDVMREIDKQALLSIKSINEYIASQQ